MENKVLCDFVGLIHAPQNFSKEAKIEFFKQIKEMYGEYFDEKSNFLRIRNVDIELKNTSISISSHKLI